MPSVRLTKHIKEVLKIYHYYIFRNHDSYIRVGLSSTPGETYDPCGSIDDGLKYVSTLCSKDTYPGLTYGLDSTLELYFMGTLPYPIKADIDRWCGLGSKTIGNLTVVTCHHLYQIRTKKKSTSFLENLRKVHKLLYERQMEILEDRKVVS